MEISIALKKIYEVYKNGDHTLGCVARADILYCIMKDNGFNPQIGCFFFKDDRA